MMVMQYILAFEETETMIKGVYAPERFLEIFRIIFIFKIAFTMVTKLKLYVVIHSFCCKITQAKYY